jgi:hypothetical protein
VVVAPSPIAVDKERVFMTGSYDAGSLMVRVQANSGKLSADRVFDFTRTNGMPRSTHPSFIRDTLFAVGKKKRGLFTCSISMARRSGPVKAKQPSTWETSYSQTECFSLWMARPECSV